MRAYIQISGVVFGVIALLHIVRLLLDWSAQIGGWTVPLWISWITILTAGALCGWAFRLVAQARSWFYRTTRFGAFLQLGEKQRRVVCRLPRTVESNRLSLNTADSAQSLVGDLRMVLDPTRPAPEQFLGQKT